MGGFIKDEMRVLSHVMAVITVTAFSIVLISLNIRQGWEKWTIPVLIASIVAVFIMHVSGKPSESDRIHIYAAILCLEIFYYALNVDVPYNITPLAVIIIEVLSMTREKKIIWICAATSSAGLIFRMISAESPGRNIWHTIIILITAAISVMFISEGEKAAILFGRYITKLQQHNKSADDFLANVSHEIRTPVNAVIGLAEVSVEREEDEENRENLKMITLAGKRIAEQISDILDYSEIESKLLAVNMEDYRLSQVTDDLMREIRMNLKPDLEMIVDIDPQIPSVMRTDVAKLKRILYHVITNAFKYTENGGVFLKFSFAEQEYGVNLRIYVEDTGQGMSAEEKERIYEQFYQADSGRSRTSGGLGLGMAIAKGFTDSMEGFITVESKEGKGTSVNICIPQKVINPEPCMVIENSDDKVIVGFFDFEKFEEPFIRDAYNRMLIDMASGLKVPLHRVDKINHLKKLTESIKPTHLLVGEEEYLTDPGFIESMADSTFVVLLCRDGFEVPAGSKVNILRKPFFGFPLINILNSGIRTDALEGKMLRLEGVKVLVVDDEPMNRMVAENILKRYGIEVSTASSGKAAVELCLKNDYDIVFMDYMMPQMDGIEAARQIRNSTDEERWPVMVAFTANAVSTAKETFLREGFRAFLNKPIEIVEIERLLRSIIPESRITYVEKAVHKDSNDNKKAEGKAKLINIEKGMGYCLNDTEMYHGVLAEFVRDSEEKIRDMEELFKCENWPEFTVRVHSIKSSSLMIGAEKLSRRARMLEEAAKNLDTEFVKREYPLFLPDYIEVVGKARGICGFEDRTDGITEA